MKNKPNRNEEFAQQLQDFLFSHLEKESEHVCRYAAVSLIHESIEIMYQNAPNKSKFEEIYKACVERIFELWKEARKENNK